MKDLLTPKQIARAIQVSESSVKRWCDRGVIFTERTAGGHRRIPLAAVFAFLRSSNHELVRPEVLGLPATTGQSERVLERARKRISEALIRGDEQACRQITFDLYLAGHSICTICDHVLSQAFREIGDQWECGSAEIYQERRGCEICTRILHELRTSVVAPPSTAPLALGGSPEGDPYVLPTTMVELALRECGWQAVSLGSGLPFDTLRSALLKDRPQLFWLSVSHVAHEADFLAGYGQLAEAAGATVAIAVGGRALSQPLRQQMTYAAHCDNLQHLVTFAQTLRQAATTPGPGQ